MYTNIFRISKTLLVAVGALTLSAVCHAQAIPTASEIPDSKVDVYAGYGYFHPVNSGINGYPYQSIYNLNATASVAGYLNRYIGVQVEGAYFSGNSPRGAFGQCRAGACNDRDPIVYTAQFGPVFRLPLHRWVPYVHVLGGGAKVNGPILQKLTWGWGVTGGVGVDYILPFWNNRLAIRPIQADYQYSQVDYGPLSPSGLEGGVGNISAIKLSGGLVARFGAPSVSRPVEMGCTTQPASVYPGEPVVAEAKTVNMNPRKTPIFTWTTSAGHITPSGAAASVDTSGLAPGDYTVAVHLSYGKRASEQSNCTSPFTVKAFEPPSITCAPNPPNVTSGGTVTINTVGISPQNRPLTYSYAASAGQITSNGPTATLSTAGVGGANITVTCNLVDDQGKTATSTTSVNVSRQPTPVIATSQAMCSMSFERDRKRPARVNNEAKGCLDDIALTLNQRSDSQLFIVGNTAAGESPSVAAERVINIRSYLVHEKGIDSSRLYLRTGDTSGRNVRTVLVPAGASFTDDGTHAVVDEQIKLHGEAYGVPRSGSKQPRHQKRRRATATPR